MIDPTLQSMCFTYTDTDSLHISGKDYKKLLQADVIRRKDKAELGLLCSDIKKEGLIIKEINNGPKTYLYEIYK